MLEPRPWDPEIACCLSSQNPFPPRELEGVDGALASIPQPALYVLGAALVAGGAGAGFTVGSQAGTVGKASWDDLACPLPGDPASPILLRCRRLVPVCWASAVPPPLSS